MTNYIFKDRKTALRQSIKRKSNVYDIGGKYLVGNTINLMTRTNLGKLLNRKFKRIK